MLTKTCESDKIKKSPRGGKEKGTSHKWEASECAKSRFGTPAYDLWKLNRGK